MLYLKVQHKTIKDEILPILKRALEEQHFILNLYVEGFEEKVVACPVATEDVTGACPTRPACPTCPAVPREIFTPLNLFSV